MADKINLNIAGFIISLSFKEDETWQGSAPLANLIKKRYKEFIFDKNTAHADFNITFIHEDRMKSLTNEKNLSFFINLYYLDSSKHLTTFYHISLYQFDLILLHVIQKLLSLNDGFFIHTSAALVNNSAVLFLGKSGEGKSTAAKLLGRYYQILADDGAIIKKENNRWYLYQTPFIEKNRVSQKTAGMYPLGMMFFLNKANYFQITKLKNKHEVANKLISQMYSQYEDIDKQFNNLISYINTHDTFFELSFKKEAKGLKEVVEKIV